MSNETTFASSTDDAVMAPDDQVVNQTLLVVNYLPFYQFSDTEFGFNATSSPLDATSSGFPLRVAHSFPGHTYPAPLESWNIVWDHICNFVVVAPRQAQNESSVTLETWMISEYDAQARKQTNLLPPNASSSSSSAGGGLYVGKADSFGALDYYGAPVGGPWQRNCGANCTFYYADADAGQIVGRNFHTGDLVSHVDNALDVRFLVAPSEPNTVSGAAAAAVCVCFVRGVFWEFVFC
jgi:hypothetical protein